MLSLVPSANGTALGQGDDQPRAPPRDRAGVEDTAGNGLLGGVVSALLDKILADPLAWLLGQTGE